MYNFFLDGKYKCKIIPHRDISPKYLLIEFPDGTRAEVFANRVKNQLTDLPEQPTAKTPKDIYCPSCGELGRNTRECEKCGKEIYASWLSRIQ